MEQGKAQTLLELIRVGRPAAEAMVIAPESGQVFAHNIQPAGRMKKAITICLLAEVLQDMDSALEGGGAQGLGMSGEGGAACLEFLPGNECAAVVSEADKRHGPLQQWLRQCCDGMRK